MSEEWRAIDGFDGAYEVSYAGQVRSLTRIRRFGIHQRICQGQVLTLQLNRYGYWCAMLSIHGKHIQKSLHRLLAQTFIPNPDGLPEINHKNGDKTDNSIDNLEWCASIDNHRHATAHGLKVNGERQGLSKLKTEDILVILRMRTEKVPVRTMADTFHVDPSSICDIFAGRTWSHVSGIPKVVRKNTKEPICQS